MAFNARFAGTCGACGDDFEVGESIEYDPDDQVVHAVPTHCTPRVVLAARPAAVCQRCWLTKPCDCDT